MKNNQQLNKQSGLTLIEIMMTVVILSLIMVGIAQFFASQNENNRQQEAQLELNENLRMGLTRISDDLRNAKFMTPRTDLDIWVSWVVGFNQNPNITPAAGSLSDIVTMLSTRPTPVGFLKSDVDIGDTSFQADGLDELPEGNYLLSINHKEFVAMTSYPSVGGSQATFSIDSDPTTLGVQGVSEDHLKDAPVYVLETVAYAANKASKTLNVNKYDNQGFLTILDNISDLEITAVTPGSHYHVTLTAVSDSVDQDTGAILTRSIQSDVGLAN